MNNEFDFKKELNKIKNLFEYKRGVVISEQKFLMTEEENLGCINNQVQSTDESDAKKYTFTRKDGKSGIQRFYKNGTWSYVTFSGDIIKGTWKCKGKSGYIIIVPTKQAAGLSGSEDPISWPSSTSSFYFDSAKNTHSFDPRGWTEGSYTEPVSPKQKPKQTQNTSKTTTKTTTPKNTKVKYVKPKELEDIKAFQDWLDANHSDEQEGVGKGWATGFPGGKLAGGSGYGTYGPRTNNAWEVWGNTYGKEKSLPIGQMIEPKKIQSEPVKLPTELKLPTNLPTLQPNQNQTGQDIYKTLYDGKKVSGDPEGGGRIRIDQTGLSPEQVEKLKSYMPELGYEYYRTRNRDNRLVFTQIRQQEPEQ